MNAAGVDKQNNLCLVYMSMMCCFLNSGNNGRLMKMSVIGPKKRQNEAKSLIMKNNLTSKFGHFLDFSKNRRQLLLECLK